MEPTRRERADVCRGPFEWEELDDKMDSGGAMRNLPIIVLDHDFCEDGEEETSS